MQTNLLKFSENYLLPRLLPESELRDSLRPVEDELPRELLLLLRSMLPLPDEERDDLTLSPELPEEERLLDDSFFRTSGRLYSVLRVEPDLRLSLSLL